MSRIAMSTPDTEPPYHPAYVLNPESDTLRIQWERNLPIDEKSWREDWVLFEHRCPIGKADDSGYLYRLSRGEQIPKNAIK